jgi:Tol biopolymer transport system component
VEHYFAIDTDGTHETPLYGAEGCGCAHLSFDGKHVLSIGPTGHGTWSLMTLNLDGSDQTVVDPPIETLNLFIGASSADGRVLAFNGVDETNAANTGLWIASPSLEDARQVTPLLEGWLTIEPFGVTPDGSKIVFFAETGPNGGATHGGDLYVINADGTGLRQLNPGGPSKPAYMGMPVINLSPDGSRAAFGVAEAVFVVELAGGEAHAITPRSGFVSAVSWSPTDDWLTYTRLHGRTPVIALVRPDGSDNHEISPIDETDEANAAVWSHDGRFLLVRRDLDASSDELNDLWIMGRDGTWISQVTHQPSSYGTYWWAPARGS